MEKKLTQQQVIDILVGNMITEVEDTVITLSNGAQLKFEKETGECCSWIELKKLATTPSIITAAKFEDDEGDGDDPYKAWIHVITEAGELNVAEADCDPGTGYYLHGFSLDVWLIKDRLEPADERDVKAAIDSIKGET